MELTSSISVETLTKMSETMYDQLVKAVVDIEQGIMMVDAGMHADEERVLLEMGSKQEDLWGINLYPTEYGADGFIEFDSIINIRPVQNNRTRGVEDPAIQQRIKEIVSEIVHA